MTRYIKDDNGRFAGSIGDGATNIPTAAPDIFVPPTNADAEQVSSETINQAYAAFTRKQPNPFVPDFADPETTDAVLKKIDKIAERYSRRMDDLSERIYNVKNGRSIINPFDRPRVLTELSKEQEMLRDAAMEARERLEAAKAIMEDREPEIVPYLPSPVLEPDDVSYVASNLRDVFGEEELQNDWDRGDLVTMDKVRRASAHILRAKRALNAAVVPAKREPELDEDYEEED